MHIHILGISGTFMGGIALLAKQQGHHVTGSDENIYPPMSHQLQNQGIELFTGYHPEHLQTLKPDQIIVGNAMKRGMPIIEYLLNEGLPYTSGPAWLAEHILPNRWVIAVAGTHGKTTTTSLLTWILECSGLNPSFLIGGIPENFGISARLTDAPFFVLEADEYDSAFFDKRSKFIHYRPRTLIINNLEFDHADIFADLNDIKKQFHHLIRTVPSNGLIIAPNHETVIAEVIAQGCWTPVVNFSLQQEAMWTAKSLSADGSHFALSKQQQKFVELKWNLLGQHNVHNALAACIAAEQVGVETENLTHAFTTFKNVKRRLELIGQTKDIKIYDDFAHHPTAIATTLNGLRNKIGNQRIIAVLELGSYTMRTGVHNQQLGASLQQADKVILLIPPENEKVNDISPYLTAHMQTFPQVDQIISHVLTIVKAHDHILIMSNSGFDNIQQKLLTALQTC